MKINIAFAEDNDFLASSLSEKLKMFSEKFSILYRAKNGAEMIDYLKNNEQKIQVILMDIEMPVMDGINATEKISKLYPNIKIIILTVFDDDEKIFSAIKAGANGYLLKDESVDKIVDGISLVLDGGAPMSPTIASKTLQLLRQSDKSIERKSEDFNLSKREIEILENLKLGLDYQQIAEKLFISPFTVRKHIENIYRKLQVNNKMQAVQKATAHKIV